jgi:hypothetical protein
LAELALRETAEKFVTSQEAIRQSDGVIRALAQVLIWLPGASEPQKRADLQASKADV